MNLILIWRPSSWWTTWPCWTSRPVCVKQPLVFPPQGRFRPRTLTIISLTFPPRISIPLMCWTCHFIAFVGPMVLMTGLRANGPQNWDKQQFWCSYTTYFLSPCLGRLICLITIITTCPSNLQRPSVHVRCCSTRGGRMSSHSRKSLVCQDYGATLSQGRLWTNVIVT